MGMSCKVLKLRWWGEGELLGFVCMLKICKVVFYCMHCHQYAWCIHVLDTDRSVVGCLCVLQERQSGDALAYNNVIQYATLRTAVCEFVERPQCPKELA